MLFNKRGEIFLDKDNAAGYNLINRLINWVRGVDLWKKIQEIN